MKGIYLVSLLISLLLTPFGSDKLIKVYGVDAFNQLKMKEYLDKGLNKE
jgi:hypothetical protein